MGGLSETEKRERDETESEGKIMGARKKGEGLVSWQ